MTAETETSDIEEVYLIPRTYGSAARTDGKLHFFFMAGEGFPANPGGNNPEKWGDSCLAVFPNGQTILIDTGMPAYAPVLMENLKRLGVTHLDHLILTHQHDDHTGAVYAPDGILEHFEVSQGWWSGTYNGNWHDPQMLNKIFTAHHVPFQPLYEGASLEIGESTIRVLSPAQGGETSCRDTEGINDTSIVMKIAYHNFTALFTGDIHPQKENELIRKYGDSLRADLLKMPHHGNNTSVSDQLPETVRPKIAAATGREYVTEIMEKHYRRTGTVILTDLQNGYIHVSTDGENIYRETSRQATNLSE